MGFTGDDTSRAVFLGVFAPKMLGILVDMDQKDSYGDLGKDCALALLAVVLGFIAGCCSSSSRSFSPCRGAEVPQVVHGSSVAGVEKTVESTRGRRRSRSHSCSSLVAQCLDILSCPLLCKTEVQTVLRSSWTRSSCPLLCKTGGCPDSAETCEVSARVLGHGRRHLCRGAEAFSLGLAIQQSLEISQLRLIDKVFDDLAVQQFPRVQAWRRQSSPTVQLVLVLGCRRGEDGRDSTVAAR